MAIQARQRCENGVYHIVMIGINRQDIFYDKDDYQCFMGTLERLKIDKFEVYVYCLMSNHVQLLTIWEGREMEIPGFILCLRKLMSVKKKKLDTPYNARYICSCGNARNQFGSRGVV